METDPHGETLRPHYRRSHHATGYDPIAAANSIIMQLRYKDFATLRTIRGTTGWDVFIKTGDGRRIHMRPECYGLRSDCTQHYLEYMSNSEKMDCQEMLVCQYCVGNER